MSDKKKYELWSKIWVNYVKYNLELISEGHEKEKEKFLGDDGYRHTILNREEIGMKIPAEVKTIIDSNCPGWPALFIKRKKGKKEPTTYLVLEPSCAVIAEPDFRKSDLALDDPEKLISWHEKIEEMKVIGGEYRSEKKVDMTGESYIQCKKEEVEDSNALHIDVTIDEKLSNFDVVIRLPFFDPGRDEFRSVKFTEYKKDKEDKQEIVLSSCC